MATMIERSVKGYPYVYISFTFGKDGAIYCPVSLLQGGVICPRLAKCKPLQYLWFVGLCRALSLICLIDMLEFRLGE